MGQLVQKFVICLFTIYAWALGYALSTLLKTCEGENLEDCVNKAESLLQNPDMTFPDDNETLQSVCRMWDEMTGCTYNYTARCLTLKENVEFHHYFQEPISSMKTVCTDKQSTEEYFRHAHCIKKISTKENFCATEYKIMIDQIISVTISTMRKICCALGDFKDCVMKADIEHVCEGGGGIEGSIASYALRTLEKSLLAFVAHSCVKEGYHNQDRCREDDEPPNELSHLREALFTNNSELQYTIAGSEIELTTLTRRPLLVPIVPKQMEKGGVLLGGGKIRANVSHFGGRGFQIPPPPMNNSLLTDDGGGGGGGGKFNETYLFTPTTKNMTELSNKNNNNSSSTVISKNSTNMERKMENNTNNTNANMNPLSPPMMTINSTTAEPQLGDKMKNMSTWFQHLSAAANKSNTSPMAEKRIDIAGPGPLAGGGGDKIFKNSTTTTTTTLLNPTVGGGGGGGGGKMTIGKPDGDNSDKNNTIISSRANGGRSLNFIESSVQNDLQVSMPTIKQNVDASQKTLNTSQTTPLPLPSTTTASNSSSNSSNSKNNNSTLNTTKIFTTSKTSTKTPREPRIMNVPNGNSLAILNQALGLSPPSTAPPVSKRNGNNDSKSKKKALLHINNTTKTEETKNTGNFSVSDVPIKVFMVWLSTFFV